MTHHDWLIYAVAPETKRALKAEAARLGLGIGETLGRMVAAMAELRRGTGDRCTDETIAAVLKRHGLEEENA